jgi:C4-type Zn-finger protein
MRGRYLSCRQCRKRMKIFSEEEGERIFYFCKNCGYRSTYLIQINGLSDDWPVEVFNDAVRSGVITKDGRVI